MSKKNISIKVRVRYGETDRMGVVYHGNYTQYLEVARVEWLRQFEISYKEMEDDGIILPVVSLKIHFIRSAYYDDVLTVDLALTKRPTASIQFDYKIYNQHQELISTAHTTLAFIDKASGRPMRCPPFLLDVLSDVEF